MGGCWPSCDECPVKAAQLPDILTIISAPAVQKLPATETQSFPPRATPPPAASTFLPPSSINDTVSTRLNECGTPMIGTMDAAPSKAIPEVIIMKQGRGSAIAEDGTGDAVHEEQGCLTPIQQFSEQEGTLLCTPFFASATADEPSGGTVSTLKEDPLIDVHAVGTRIQGHDSAIVTVKVFGGLATEKQSLPSPVASVDLCKPAAEDVTGLQPSTNAGSDPASAIATDPASAIATDPGSAIAAADAPAAQATENQSLGPKATVAPAVPCLPTTEPSVIDEPAIQAPAVVLPNITGSPDATGNELAMAPTVVPVPPSNKTISWVTIKKEMAMAATTARTAQDLTGTAVPLRGGTICVAAYGGDSKMTAAVFDILKAAVSADGTLKGIISVEASASVSAAITGNHSQFTVRIVAKPSGRAAATFVRCVDGSYVNVSICDQPFDEHTLVFNYDMTTGGVKRDGMHTRAAIEAVKKQAVAQFQRQEGGKK